MGLQKVWETTDSNPPWTNQTIYPINSWCGVRLCCAFCQAEYPVEKKLPGTKTLLPNQHVLTFLHPKLSVQSIPVEELV